MGRFLGKEPVADIKYSVKGMDKNSRSAASIIFDMKTHTGFHLGALQCFFPHATSAATIEFDRWVSVVGSHLTLEIRQ